VRAICELAILWQQGKAVVNPGSTIMEPRHVIRLSAVAQNAERLGAMRSKNGGIGYME